MGDYGSRRRGVRRVRGYLHDCRAAPPALGRLSHRRCIGGRVLSHWPPSDDGDLPRRQFGQLVSGGGLGGVASRSRCSDLTLCGPWCFGRPTCRTRCRGQTGPWSPDRRRARWPRRHHRHSSLDHRPCVPTKVGSASRCRAPSSRCWSGAGVPSRRALRSSTGPARFATMTCVRH
jgi:hypothetical protein